MVPSIFPPIGSTPLMMSVTGLPMSANFLEALQRQVRHISFEFIRLKSEHFGPNSQEASAEGRELVSQRLTDFFVEACNKGIEESVVLETAKLGEATLREIRTLQGTEHFFSKTLDAFYRSLSFLGVDYEDFASALVWELHKYRKLRDEEESRFLQPFHEYRDQLLAIVGKVLPPDLFTFFSVEDRIKHGGLLAKIQKRHWRDMQEFYDLVGLRVMLGSQREVDAAVALVEGALKVHEAKAITNPEVPYYFKIAGIELKGDDPKCRERGYRASHINVRRFTRQVGDEHPTAEIQVMSRGIRDWGEIQRLIVYKDDLIPETLKTMISAHCREVADYIVALEDGQQEVGSMPEFDITMLNEILDVALQNDVFDRICDLESLMIEYHSRLGSAHDGKGETL